MERNADKPFKCTFCDKSYSGSSGLYYHMKKHSGEKSYQCKHCDQAFASINSLESHLNTHSGVNQYKCNHCCKSFSHKIRLEHHLNINSAERLYQCSLCVSGFWYKCEFTQHINNHCDKQIVSQYVNPSSIITGKNTYQCKREKLYKCHHCDKAFYNKHELRTHIRKFLCKSSLKKHILTYTGENSFKCKQCHKAFSIKCNLVRHLLTHTGEKPHKCGICYKAFSLKANLMRHHIIHTKEKPYKCTLCDKAFSLAENLKRHWVRKGLTNHLMTHTRDKQFQCSYCNHIFLKNKDLIIHLKKCKNGMPYQVSKSFSEKKNVKHEESNTENKLFPNKGYSCKEKIHILDSFSFRNVEEFAKTVSLYGDIYVNYKPLEECVMCYEKFCLPQYTLILSLPIRTRITCSNCSLLIYTIICNDSHPLANI